MALIARPLAHAAAASSSCAQTETIDGWRDGRFPFDRLVS